MNTLELETLVSSSPSSNETKEEFSIPLNINDIINICREYNKLGWQIQNQVENILKIGVADSIKHGKVKIESLPHIKDFLCTICKNPYFGDAIDQAQECIYLIDDFTVEYKSSNYN